MKLSSLTPLLLPLFVVPSVTGQTVACSRNLGARPRRERRRSTTSGWKWSGSRRGSRHLRQRITPRPRPHFHQLRHPSSPLPPPRLRPQPHQRAVATPPVLTPADAPTLDLFRGTTISVGLDGYYGYNFNQPIGRVNLLRAYDVTDNSFNLNQASLILERLPTTESRLGGRIDLQFGQATETLQGSSANEQRPQVWRNLYQAYGSYLAPVGSGLELDFGKFASSLGNEGNYTKDQIAYSRAYLFNYLPFYHMGLRANYNVTPKVNVAYWLVNGANDTEDLNGYKSQAFLFTLKPASTITWNVNYYFGEEARDVLPTLNPGLPIGPVQPGLPTTNISPAPNGREHIFDTYATWQATKRLKLVGEADYVLNRTYAEQQPGPRRHRRDSRPVRPAAQLERRLARGVLRRSRRPLQRRRHRRSRRRQRCSTTPLPTAS